MSMVCFVLVTVKSKSTLYLVRFWLCSTYFGCSSFISLSTGQGNPIDWVSTHRYHHQFCDSERDPHSPLEGFWFSHISWLFDTDYVIKRVWHLIFTFPACLRIQFSYKSMMGAPHSDSNDGWFCASLRSQSNLDLNEQNFRQVGDHTYWYVLFLCSASCGLVIRSCYTMKIRFFWSILMGISLYSWWWWFLCVLDGDDGGWAVWRTKQCGGLAETAFLQVPAAHLHCTSYSTWNITLRLWWTSLPCVGNGEHLFVFLFSCLFWEYFQSDHSQSWDCLSPWNKLKFYESAAWQIICLSFCFWLLNGRLAG